jgi:hypothetical protein
VQLSLQHGQHELQHADSEYAVGAAAGAAAATAGAGAGSCTAAAAAAAGGGGAGAGACITTTAGGVVAVVVSGADAGGVVRDVFHSVDAVHKPFVITVCVMVHVLQYISVNRIVSGGLKAPLEDKVILGNWVSYRVVERPQCSGRHDHVVPAGDTLFLVLSY